MSSVLAGYFTFWLKFIGGKGHPCGARPSTTDDGDAGAAGKRHPCDLPQSRRPPGRGDTLAAGRSHRRRRSRREETPLRPTTEPTAAGKPDTLAARRSHRRSRSRRSRTPLRPTTEPTAAGKGRHPCRAAAVGSSWSGSGSAFNAVSATQIAAIFCPYATQAAKRYKDMGKARGARLRATSQEASRLPRAYKPGNFLMSSLRLRLRFAPAAATCRAPISRETS